ncbi:MAG: CBS domain-containing protein [Acidobacteria bacterium]|nr:CBS domain-containing protein [Acidobacteriota bacterium]
MKVEELMTRDVRFCRPQSNLSEAVSIMWDTDCGILPVIDDGGRVIGLITDRDIAIAIATKDRRASEISASEVTSGQVYAISPEEDVRSALNTMRLGRVRRIPVTTGDGKLVGMLSLNDIVLRAVEVNNRFNPDYTYQDLVGTVREICEHRTQQAAARA